MKKQVIYFVVMFMILVQTLSSYSLAADNVSVVQPAIKKYKAGNYTGCLQDCQSIIQKYPSNSIAYYYMAMSYAQAGKKNEAINAYSKVLSLNPNSKLMEYATAGKRCLEFPDGYNSNINSISTPETSIRQNINSSPNVKPNLNQNIKPKQALYPLPSPSSNPNSSVSPFPLPSSGSNNIPSATDLDKFIARPPADGLSNTVRNDLEQKRLQRLKDDINNNINNDNFRKINDASGQSTIEKQSEALSEKPTNEKIAEALKILNEAGISPYPQTNDYNNPQAAQLAMLMNGNKNVDESNSMLNMLPFMFSQDKNTQNNNYNPQLMQAVIMNSMMSNLNLDLNKDENEY